MLLYEYLAVFISLTAFLDPVRSNNSSVSDGCVQETKKGHCCLLPFVHKEKTYHSCTKVDSGLLGFNAYYWCYYDKDKNFDRCKEPIIHHPPRSTPSTTKPTKQHISQFSSTLNVVMTTTSDLVSQIPRPSRIGMSSPSSSITTVLARSETETKSSSTTKHNIYIILACGIGGGVLLTVIIAVTVIIYFKRKRKLKVSKQEQENEQEMKSYRLTAESNNPVYESIDKDLDIQSNEEQQVLPHVYQELEDPQSPTSCSHEYDTPYDTSIPNSNGRETTPALNKTDGFIHKNELYEAS